MLYEVITDACRADALFGQLQAAAIEAFAPGRQLGLLCGGLFDQPQFAFERFET